MTQIDIDVIGVLFDTPAFEGGSPVALAGWHVNITTAGLAARPELGAFVVTPEPTSLRRVWAGDDPETPMLTVPLRFTDEAQWDGQAGAD